MSKLPPSLPGMVERQVLETPNAIAIKYNSRKITYASMNEKADKLADHLKKNGIFKNAAVGVCMDKCPEAVISILAILKAGAGYVPLDPHYPRERLAIMLEDSGITIVLTMRAESKYIPEELLKKKILLIHMDTFFTSGDDDNKKRYRTMTRQDTEGALELSSSPPPLKPPTFSRGVTLPTKSSTSFSASLPFSSSSRDASPLKMDKENFLSDDSKDLAYIIFTSGSTGRPKGIEMPRGPLKNLIVWQNGQLKKKLGLRTLQFAPISFDVHFQEIFGSLTTGGTICLVNEDIRRDSTSLLRYLRTNKINRIFFPFVALQSLVEASTLLSDPRCEYLEEFITAGEQLKCSKQVKTFFEANPQAILHNHYGPSETHVCTSYTLKWPTTDWPDLPPIGKGLPGCDCYILDDKLKTVAPGEEGELYIGGICLARGYINRPEVTAKAFIKDTVTKNPKYSPIMYKTGDKVVQMKDGNIYYLGRLDGQVKIRGHRVEVLEIENCINKHPWVATEAVIAIESGDTGLKQLVAYIVPIPEQSGIENSKFITELRNHCKATLAEYMIPSAFIKLLVLPLTPSGKLDRRALPMPDTLRTQLTKSIDGNELKEGMQKDLGEIFCSIFGIPFVSPDDDFFSLGGHSLTVTQLIVRVSKAMGLQLKATDIFNNSSLSALAEVLEKLKLKSKNESTSTLRQLPVIKKGSPSFSKGGNNFWPLTFGQESMLFMSRLSNDSNSALNISFSADIVPIDNKNSNVNTKALGLAVATMVASHEALRTVFVEIDGKSYATLVDDQDFTKCFSVKLCSSKDQMENDLIASSNLTFNLAIELPIRVILFQCEGQNPVLLFVVHHIASDLWSLMIMMRDFSLSYDSALQSTNYVVKSLHSSNGIGVFDYAVWQRENYGVGAKELAPSEVYWTEVFKSNALDPLELPLDFSRPTIQSFKGKVISKVLDSNLTSQIGAIARKLNSTTYSALLSAYSVLISRHTNTEDVTIGTPLANRSASQDLESVVGYFINPVPMRCFPASKLSFESLLKETSATVVNGIGNQDFPFPLLVDKFGGKRDVSRSPIFQTMLVWQSTASSADAEEYLHLVLSDCSDGIKGATPLGTNRSSGFMLNPRNAATNVSQYEIILHVMALNDGSWSCNWSYNTSLFLPESIERLIEHFEILLRGIVAHPEAPISSLPIMSKNEMDIILNNWGGLGRAKSPWRTGYFIHERVESMVEALPNSIALSHNGKNLTYAELNQKANDLAAYLRKQGVTLEKVVSVCIHRTLEMVIACLAIIKAGGGYLMIDPSYPLDRIKYMVMDSKSLVVISQKSIKAHVAEAFATKIDDVEGGNENLTLPIVCLDSEWETTIGTFKGSSNMKSLGTPDNLFNVVYTSGSSGRPKGIMVNHNSMTNMLGFTIDQFSITNNDILSQFTSIGFDPLAMELFGSTMVGARLIIGDDEIRLSSEKLIEFLTINEVTVASIATPICELLMKLKWPENSKLRAMYTGGDKLHSGPNENIKFTVYNCYGPAEATIVSTCYKCLPNDLEPPIGSPLGNTFAYVVDNQRNAVPMGVHGQLCLAGANLSRGYLNNPILTAEKYVRDPFNLNLIEGRENKMYLSGDLVKFDRNGQIVFLGRIDNQIKIRGQRVELGEIEAACIESMFLKEAMVRVAEHSKLGKIIEAYVVPKSTTDMKSIGESLIKFLKSKLPSYMVPSKLYSVTALARTANGKLMRKGNIPGAEELSISSISNQGGEKRKPKNIHEEILVQIWSLLLGVSTVTIDDDFFELGGHSLMATSLVAAIRKSFATEVPVSVIFENPTLEQQALAIQKCREENDENLLGNKKVKLESLYKALTSENLKDQNLMATVAPLSYNERSMWFMHKLDRTSSAYNCNVCIKILSLPNVQALKDTVTFMLERHSILRAQYLDLDNGSPCRIIADLSPSMNHFNEIEMHGADLNVCTAKLKQLVTVPFNLRTGPLMRTTLINRNGDESLLLLEWHHVVIDGWSVSLFIQEFAKVYESICSKTKLILKEPSFHYLDYAAWQSLSLTKVDISEHTAYWREILSAHVQPLEIPTDHPRPPVLTTAGSSYTTYISRDVLAKLSKLGKSTTFSALFAVYFILLYRYTGQKDIIVGVPLALRDMANGAIENMIGYTVNTIPILLTMTSDLSFNNILNRIRAAMIQSYKHQSLPFSLLIENLKLPRDASRTPLYQTLFSYDTPNGDSNTSSLLFGHCGDILKFGGMDVSPFLIPETTSPVDFTLVISDSGTNELRCKWQYNTALFEESTIVRIASSFINLIESCCSEPNISIANLNMISNAEKRLILETWNDTKVDYSSKILDPLHIVFEKHAKKSPSSLALTFGNKVLSYNQLNSRANELAHYLISLGVKKGSAVAVCCKRSIDMVVAFLSILKAGGTYVPTDPAYPQARLQYMINDAKVKVVIGHSFVADRLSNKDTTLVLLDTEWITKRTNFQTTNPISLVSVSDVANIVYTSGSTGKPKGIMVEHMQLLNVVLWEIDFFHLTCEDRHAQVIAPAFDPVALEIWSMLVVGGSIHICDDETRLSTSEFVQFVLDRDITICTLATPVAELMMQAEWPDEISLRAIYAGGDKLHFGPKKKLPFDVYNVYGPAECAVLSTYYKTSVHQLNPPIGKPISNASVFVLDKNQSLCPIGVAGELLIGGHGVARGYFERPELTAEKFVPNPLLAAGLLKAEKESLTRVYKTGDLAKYLPTGDLEFIGRIDTQVKIRGNRVELGEIEAACLESGCCKECCVVAVNHDTPQGSSKLIAAYVVPFDEGVDLDLLKAFLVKRLPEYEIPAGFTVLTSLPLTANGKVDKTQLPTPKLTTAGSFNTKDLPVIIARSETEKSVALIWANVLGLDVDHVSIYDNFFEVGGHSMAAATLISLVNTQFNIKLGLFKIFQSPTIAGISLLIDETLYGPQPKLRRKSSNKAVDGLKNGDFKEDIKEEDEIEEDDTSKSMIKDAQLVVSSNIVCPMKSNPPAKQTILVTGATGFLGSYLVRDLLKMTNHFIYCIVRGKDVNSATARMIKILTGYGLYTTEIQDLFSKRVRILIGDLGSPLLGIESDVWDVLSGLVDVIFHNGANVHFIMPYNALRADNVLGTLEVIKLATTTKLKAVHYVSTLSTMAIPFPDDSNKVETSPLVRSPTNKSLSPSSSNSNLTFFASKEVPSTKENAVHGFTIYEDTPLPNASEMHGGYSQTKWVAEKLIWSASKLGVPITIHRPGRITGDSKSGVANLEDMLYRVIKGCIQIGAYPDIKWSVDMAPVDWVSAVIVTVCTSNDLSRLGKAYHIMSKSFIQLVDLFNWFKLRGFALKCTSYTEWRQILMNDSESALENAVYPLIPLLDEMSDGSDEMPRIDSTNTDNLTEKTVHCAEISHELLECYLSYFISSGFLHAQNSLKLTDVKVICHELSGSTPFTKHVNFFLQVNFGTTSWRLKKRYTEFSNLYEQMKLFNNGKLVLPELPEKGVFKNFGPDYLNEKAKKLDTYLKELVQLFPDVNACAPLREFFKTQSKMPTLLSPSDETNKKLKTGSRRVY